MDDAMFHLWMKECRTPKFLQAWTIQSFSEVMVVLSLSEATRMLNATFHRWMMACHTPRFLQVRVTACSSEVMARSLPVAAMIFANAEFHLQLLGPATSAINGPWAEILFANGCPLSG